MGGRSAGGIFAGKIYRTWHCDSVFSGAGNGAYKSGDRILHGAKQCVARADGVKQVLRRADLLAGMRDNGYAGGFSYVETVLCYRNMHTG